MSMGTLKLNIEKQMDEPVQIDNVRAINVKNESGEDMYTIMIDDDGALEIRTNGIVTIEGRIKDNRILVQPEAYNSILVMRPDYE